MLVNGRGGKEERGREEHVLRKKGEEGTEPKKRLLRKG
jgi:hypothetical protein